MTTPLRHVYLSNEAETVSWRGHTLCLLCYEQFGLPQVIEDGDSDHRWIYHVVLPARLAAVEINTATQPPIDFVIDTATQPPINFVIEPGR